MAQTMLTGTRKSKAVMGMPVENKTKALITATRQFIRNHGSFNYTFFSTLCAIIGHFTTFERWPLRPSNAECFVGETWISVLNSSKLLQSDFSKQRLITLNIYIFIVIALDETSILGAVQFSMQNIYETCDLRRALWRSNVDVHQ